MNKPALIPLGKLAKFINGDRGGNYPSKSDFVDDGIPFINAGHLAEGSVCFTDMNHISEKCFQKLGSGKTEPNDLLYCLRGSLGKTAILQYPGNAAIASSLVIIRPFDQCLVKYLYWFLTSPFGKSEIHRFDNGSSQPNLSVTSVKKYQIPLPPLAEQKRIAKILDAADALRSKRRESLAQLDTLLQSTFLDMFGDPVTNPKGWEERTIDEVVKKCTSWNPKKSGQGTFDYIDLSSIDKNLKAIVSVEQYQCFEAPSRARQLVETGDILVATVRPNLNGVAFVEKMHNGMTASTGYCVLRPIKKVLESNFLFQWVKTNAFVQRMIDVAIGANYPAVSDAKVKGSTIPLPPLSLQQKFASIVESVEKQKARQREHLAEMDTLFASLQQRAFNGELSASETENLVSQDVTPAQGELRR